MAPESFLGPWAGIDRVLKSPPAHGASSSHPRRSELLRYLRGRLPRHPEAWTKERAHALATGRLRDWTQLELAAHLSGCPACRDKLQHLQEPASTRAWQATLDQVRSIRQPTRMRIGWVLAGAQALALAGLIIWIGAFRTTPPPTAPSDPLPPIPHLSQLDSAFNAVPRVQAQFSPDAQLDEINVLLGSIGARLYGPNAQGYYELFIPSNVESALDELRESPIVAGLLFEEGE